MRSIGRGRVDEVYQLQHDPEKPGRSALFSRAIKEKEGKDKPLVLCQTSHICGSNLFRLHEIFKPDFHNCRPATGQVGSA